GRSSVKMLRDANSAGLEKVRYSRMAGVGDAVVNHGSGSRRAVPPVHGGTRPSRRFLARYSAMAATSAFSLGSCVNAGSRSIVAYLASIVGARSNVSTNSARATSWGTPLRTLSTASARVFGRMGSSLTAQVLQ